MSVQRSFPKKNMSDKLLKIYQESINFVVVRNPLERLVSAYLDKVERNPLTKSSIFSKFSWKVAQKYGKRWKSDTKSI